MSSRQTRRSMYPAEADERASDDDVDLALASLLQNWLVLGFLEDICQVAISMSYLTRFDNVGVASVNTRNLPFLLYAQKLRISKLPLVERSRYLIRAQDIVASHQDIVEALVESLNLQIAPYAGAEDEEVEAALGAFPRLLNDVLTLATKISEITVYSLNNSRVSDDEDPAVSYSRPLQELAPKNQLLEAGFCPTFFEQQNFKTLSASHWLAWWGESTGISKLENHGECEEELCALENFTESNSQHSDSCDKRLCVAVKPSLSDVMTAISAGAFPLMQITNRADKALALSVKQVANLKPVKYIAISHVWRHGLGSTSEHGLPCCRIRSLWEDLTKSRVCEGGEGQDAQASPFFWIDSLCIPASPEQRKIAIQGINQIFRESSEVLVIDKNLTSIKKPGATAETLLAATVCSGWQTRCVDSRTLSIRNCKPR